jgi:hypothetical protein
LSKITLERQVESTRLQDGSVSAHDSIQLGSVTLSTTPPGTPLWSILSAPVSGTLVIHGFGVDNAVSLGRSSAYNITINGTSVTSWGAGNLNFALHTSVNKGDTIIFYGQAAGGAVTLQAAQLTYSIFRK